MYIKIKVFSDSKREEVIEKDKNHYILYIKEKPKMNLANKKVCEIIAKEFNVPIKSVHIVNGHHSPSKILSINDEVL